MHRMTFLMVLVTACGSKAPPASTPTPANTSSAPASADVAGGTADPMSGCGDGYDVVCSPDRGLVDGCDERDASGNTLTTEHACVIASTLGPPCSQELALDCTAEGAKISPPAQMVDACLMTPPKATSHICVVAPGATIGKGSGTGTSAGMGTGSAGK